MYQRGSAGTPLHNNNDLMTFKTVDENTEAGMASQNELPRAIYNQGLRNGEGKSPMDNETEGTAYGSNKGGD